MVFGGWLNCDDRNGWRRRLRRVVYFLVVFLVAAAAAAMAATATAQTAPRVAEQALEAETALARGAYTGTALTHFSSLQNTASQYL